jgi:hypothetical protein
MEAPIRNPQPLDMALLASNLYTPLKTSSDELAHPSVKSCFLELSVLISSPLAQIC